MFRRLQPAPTRPSSALLSLQSNAYSGIGSIIVTTLGGMACTIVGAQWGHSFYNLHRHGRFRVRMEMDNDGPTVYRPVQYLGGAIFFVCWFFWWGPRRFAKTDLGKVQPQWGPY